MTYDWQENMFHLISLAHVTIFKPSPAKDVTKQFHLQQQMMFPWTRCVKRCGDTCAETGRPHGSPLRVGSKETVEEKASAPCLRHAHCCPQLSGDTWLLPASHPGSFSSSHVTPQSLPVGPTGPPAGRFSHPCSGP